MMKAYISGANSKVNNKHKTIRTPTYLIGKASNIKNMSANKIICGTRLETANKNHRSSSKTFSINADQIQIKPVSVSEI